MLEPRWTYSNPTGLSKWYGHVDYYGQYVIGQWFALDAETGTQYWTRRFFRPTTVCGCAHDVIVASETRSDGPWTAGFGVYGIDAQTGKLRWVNHGRGLWGKLLRCFDYVPGFTNEFRDVPKCLVDQYVVTTRGRILDVRTGHDCSSVKTNEPNNEDRSGPQHKLYDNKTLETDGHTIKVEGHRDDFVILRRDKNGNDIWRFAAKDLSLHVDGNYYSYRFHDGRIFIILGDAPNYVPINEAEPLYVKPNPANYQLGILDVSSGKCKLAPMANAKQRKECRIESIRDSRMLVSCDGTELAEYEIEK
ncbi:hypothetical protein FYK55_17170 [Roseiconus nitratireducens]|uniref:PQQ enzyme-like repeat protein n=1 Tax=Roseiconus nitratireducens TaxID=2605748 RepID=A0A5M6D592_9BACT|nr:PQQ-binding-like beta-propeller repeat protein [Roseiconus nitratireducens]KAA5541926.1 hypothetical protein FYK55_17170 [Roseiconus nitratireducens]